MHGPSSEGSFMAEVIATTPGAETLITCLQCGTCGGSCPSGPDMDHTPRQLFAMIGAGMREEVLRSNTPWYCVACYYCTVRCPKDIPSTDLMYALKRMAVREKLADMQQQTGEVEVPLSYNDDLYRLRSHIRFVSDLIDRLSAQDKHARV